MAELFHGPTFCFKDLGMRVTIFLLDYFASRPQKGKEADTPESRPQVTFVVSTTGDTGPAAVQAVHDAQSDQLGILVHYPLDQISDFQRKQLTTIRSSRIRIVAYEGGGDGMDSPIKRIMTGIKGVNDKKDDSPEEKNRWVCGVNSYNIGRPLMQMVHFVS